MTEPPTPAPSHGGAGKPRKRKPHKPQPAQAATPVTLSIEAEKSGGEEVTVEEVEAAVALASELDRPIRIPPERRLDTGLADYAMWCRIFSAAPPQPPVPPDHRTGRIWA
jgi:cyanobactin cluster PatC/TenC/TruC protein